MIYIRKADEPFWEKLEQIARDQGQELSPYLSTLVRNHVYSVSAGERVQQSLEQLALGLQRGMGELVEKLRAGEES